MSTIGGNNSIQDGLVFAYDTGNKLKSFKGEPTVNVVTNTNLDTGWSKGYCTGILWDDIPPPAGVKSPVVSFYDSNTDQAGFWYSYGDYAPQVPGEIYTISLYVKTRDSNLQIYAYTADNAEIGRQNSNTVVVPNDGKWYRVIFNPITNPLDSTSDSLSFRITYGNTQGESQRTWLCAPQMEANDHATPFTPNTRTATDSLLDLTKNTTIDVTNTSFDSEGQMFFDGVNDTIPIDPTIIPNGNEFSFEVWNFGETFGSTSIIEAKDSIGNRILNIHLTWGGGIIYFDAGYDAGYDRIYKTATSQEYMGWHHWVFIKDVVTGTMEIYQDGELWHSGTAKTKPLVAANAVNIGSYVAAVGAFHKGKVPIAKIYNKALTPQEVKRNFQAIRGRFNI